MAGDKKNERDQGEYQTWTRRDGNALGNDRFGRSLPEPRVDNITVKDNSKEKSNGKH